MPVDVTSRVLSVYKRSRRCIDLINIAMYQQNVYGASRNDNYRAEYIYINHGPILLN